jgi:hypothetical protein
MLEREYNETFSRPNFLLSAETPWRELNVTQRMTFYLFPYFFLARKV